MRVDKIYIKIDGFHNVICISEELESIVFYDEGVRLTERGKYLDNYPEKERYKSGPYIIKKNKDGGGWTHKGVSVHLDDVNELISKYLKIAMMKQDRYVFEINDVQYATSWSEMSAKIQGPLDTERNITMSDEEIEYKRDRRIYLPK